MIKAALILLRPINVVITMASVYLGGIISFDSYFAWSLALASVSAGAIAGFGNVINDIFDIDLDRRAKPFRPLPSGKIGVRSAVILALALVAVGLVLAGVISRAALIMASLAAMGLLIYNPLFKGRGFAGNLLISAISASAFLYGSVSVSHPAGGVIPALFALMFHFVREVVKDLEDIEADRAFGVRTGVVAFGPPISQRVAAVVTIALIGATSVPYIAGLYGSVYLLIVAIGTDLPLAYLVIKLISGSERSRFRFISGSMKAIIPLGLLAIFVGSRGL